MKSVARTVIWILIFAAAIAAYVLLAQRASAQSLPPVSWLETRVRTVSATYFFEADAAAVLGMYFDTSCTVTAAGTWRYNEDNEIVLSSRGGSVTLAGAKAVMNVNLGTLQEPIEPDGMWFRVITPWRMAWRWAEVPQRIIRPDGSTFEMNLPACDAGPFLPLVTSGPAEPGFFISAGIMIVLILILHSNRRPTPPMLFEEVQDGTESRVSCDCCDETWEKEFFCPNCSHRVQVRQELVPNLMWDGLPSDAMVWEDVHDSVGNICFNCCTCYYRRPHGRTPGYILAQESHP